MAEEFTKSEVKVLSKKDLFSKIQNSDLSEMLRKYAGTKKFNPELTALEARAVNTILTVFSKPRSIKASLEVLADYQSQLSGLIGMILGLLTGDPSALPIPIPINIPVPEAVAKRIPENEIRAGLLILSNAKLAQGTKQAATRFSLTTPLINSVSNIYKLILKTLNVDINDVDVKAIISDPKIIANILISSIVYRSGLIAAEKQGPEISKLFSYYITARDLIEDLLDVNYNSATLALTNSANRLLMKMFFKFKGENAYLSSLIADSSGPILSAIIITKAKNWLG
jgi:hypothetical protein